jgi:hypothetical protein
MGLTPGPGRRSANRLGDPHDTEYGPREIGIVDADGTLHSVGSGLTHIASE